MKDVERSMDSDNSSPRTPRITKRGRCSCLLASVSLAALLVAPSCPRGRTLKYQVELPAPSASSINVSLTIHGLSGSNLDLKGYAAGDVMRVDSLRAIAPDGRQLGVVEVADTVSAGGKRIATPRYRVIGPMPSTLNIRYRVSPGRREGDEHMGFSGRSFGYVGAEFAMVTGRGLFLLPEPVASWKRIRVGFALPEGWSAVAPWSREKQHWSVEADGSDPSELLVTASIGLGPFHEEEFRCGRTRVRVAFANGISSDEVRRTAAAIERVVRYVRDRFGRDLGAEYMIVAVPETPERDEIVGEGWAFGQGGTMTPLTPERLRRFAQELIGAYTRHAPFRTEIRHPEEFWLIDGVQNWYSWRAVAAAGLADEEAVARDLATGYLTAVTTHGVERNLERLYAGSSPDHIAQETLAPFALYHLDHELRNRGDAAAGFDRHLPRFFAGRSAPCLWSILPGRSVDQWEPYRKRYVRNAALVPVPDLFALAPARPTPTPSGGPPVRFLTVAYTGNTYGYLENCGCKANQSGGVARRATILGRIQHRDPEAVILDAGNTFVRPERAGMPSFLAIQEQRLYLETLDLMGYQAAAIGLTELAGGLEYFRNHTRGLRVPFLASNILHDGEPIGPPLRVIRSHGLSVAVIAVLEPPRGGNPMRGFNANASRLTITDPIAAVRRAALQNARADLIAVLGRLSPSTIRRVADSCPDIDLIISTDYDGHQWLKHGSAGRRMMAAEDSSGFLGRTLVLYTYKGQYGLASARLGVDRSGYIVSAEPTEYWLGEDVPDESAVRDRLNRFYDSIGEMQMAQESVHAPLSGDPYWQGRPYVGAAACAACHDAQYAQWKTTPHATAYKTLLDRHRHYQPSCISCHVVGFGSKFGYRVGQPEDPLGNVQCEVCHGPGADHVSNPGATNIRRQVPERVCLECHDSDHSDNFIYSERLPMVRHDAAQLSLH